MYKITYLRELLKELKILDLDKKEKKESEHYLPLCFFVSIQTQNMKSLAELAIKQSLVLSERLLKQKSQLTG